MKNHTTGGNRPNSTAASQSLADGYDALTCQLEQTGAVLRLLLADTRDGTVLSPHLYPALCGLQSLFELADAQHSRLCDGLGCKGDALLQAGCLLDQCGAVLWHLIVVLSGDEPPADKVFNAMCALDCLLNLAQSELERAWDALPPDRRDQGAEDGTP